MCVIGENVEHIVFTVLSGYLLQHFWLRLSAKLHVHSNFLFSPPFAGDLADFSRFNEEPYDGSLSNW